MEFFNRRESATGNANSMEFFNDREGNQFGVDFSDKSGHYISAYAIAVANGFTGTEEEWLETLKGEPGKSGVYIGEDAPTDPDVNVWIKPSGKANIETYLDDYRPYWRVLNTLGFINASCSEDLTGSYKPKVTGANSDGSVYTEDITAALPYPMASAIVVGATNKAFDVRNIVNKGDPVYGVTYKLHSPNGEATGTALSALVRLHLMGVVADVPKAPTIAADTSGKADEARAIAQSYVGSANGGDCPIPFVYGANWTYTSASSQYLIAPSTRVKIDGQYMWGGRMECDAFVDMILRGISYEDSPYAAYASYISSKTEKKLAFADMREYENPDSLAWVSWLLADGRLHENPYMKGTRQNAVRFEQDLAWFAWSINDGTHACIFADPQYAANGDIAFYKSNGETTFDNVSHVAFVGANSDEDDTLYVYECSTETSEHPTAIYKRPLEGHKRTPAYFVRLNYAAMQEGET